MFTPTQEVHVDFENLNFDHFNGLYTHISPQIYKIRSVSDRNNARSHVFTYIVYLITECVHGTTLFERTIRISLLSVKCTPL